MNLRWLLTSALALCLQTAHAATVVEDCTQASLLSAIAQDSEVLFDDACTITISNQIVITRDTVIDGAGLDVTLTAGGTNRLFQVRRGATLTLSGLRLTSGKASVGGAIYVLSGGSAVVTNCWFESNQAIGDDGIAGEEGEDDANEGESGGHGSDGAEALGGAIYSEGSLRLLVCQFLTNSATGGDGGVGGAGGNGGFRAGNGGDGGYGGAAFGGAIFCAGPFFAQDCLFEGNTCVAGNGAIGGDAGSGPFYGLPGEAGPGANASGGAVCATGGSAILSSTFFGNTVTAGNSAENGTDPSGSGQNGHDGGLAAGGGLWAASGGITNCTFYGNAVRGGNGGHGGPGVFTGGDGGDGGHGQGGAALVLNIARIVNSTFANNSALGGTNGLAGNGPFPGESGDPGKAQGGHLASPEGGVTFKNSILGTNAAGGNVYGNVLDGGHNIVWDTTFKIQFSTSRRANARLDVLASNGGPTPTMALLTNSPAVNAADNSWAPASDQRGVPRPVGPAADIGAYERSLTISGRVLSGTTGLAGVLITVGEVEVETDSQGNFNAPAGNGALTIVPSLPGYIFTPAFTNLANVTNNVTNIVFSAVRVFTVTGRVLQGSNGLAAIRVFLGTNSVLTTSSGSYSIAAPAGGYTLYPTSACYRFTPPSTNAIAGSTTNRFNFEAVPDRFSISGRVLLGTNADPVAGVTLSVGDQSTVSDSLGAFLLTNFCRGTFTVRASRAGFGFLPGEALVTVGPDATNLVFLAVPGQVAAGVVFEGATPLPNVQLRTTNSAAPPVPVATSGTNGVFTLVGLQTNTTYEVTPQLLGYGFQPPTVEVTSATSTNSLRFQAFPMLMVTSTTNRDLFQITFPGSPGKAYVIETSTNLTAWQPFATNVAPVKFEAPISNTGARYFRLRNN